MERLTAIRCFCPQITPEIRKFSQRFRNGKPVFVSVEPVANGEVHDCVNIVQQHVAKAGGAAVNGWAIWEWPTIVLEAEFHVVWKAVQPPSGAFV